MLKVGSPIMLLKSLDAPRLCNSTRLCVKKVMSHVMEATVLAGYAKDSDAFLPQIPADPE